MFPLAFSLSLIGLIIASYTDLKSRIIPNWIPYSMVVAGVLIAGYSSYQTNSIEPLFWSIAIMAVTYAGAYLFWKLGAWAGGDVKLFTGLAALNPFNLNAIGSLLGLSFFAWGKEWIAVSSLPVFMLNLFMFSVVMLIPYTALLSLRSLTHASRRKEFFTLSFHSILSGVEYALLIALFTVIFNAMQWPLILILVPLIPISFLPKWVGYVGSLVGLYLVYVGSFGLSELIPLVLVLILVNILRAWYGFAQKHVLTRTKRISDLQDGDIVGERIVKVGDKVVREPSVSFQMIIKAGFRRDIGMIMRFLNPTGEILADPRRAAGVYPEDIERLQKEVKAGRLTDEIKVKASSPFAPAVLLAYVFLNLIGDNFLAWIGRV